MPLRLVARQCLRQGQRAASTTLWRGSAGSAVSGATHTPHTAAPPTAVQRYAHTRRQSVTTVVYPSDPAKHIGLPVVDVYTTANCGLCDAAVEVLWGVKRVVPHVLRLQDITDHQHRSIFRSMKHEIPVLHINNKYWTKHRITHDEAVTALHNATAAAASDDTGPSRTT
eukprot:m.209741 g.209741  ORF g.209741 m.209741 type:complete len:169 (-) comp24711_c0_seq1:134-640(-)